MSSPDYYQKAEDHHSLLVIIKHIGSHLNQKTFNRTYERITRLRSVKVPNCNPSRTVWLRYKTQYLPVNNEWGDFQTFRKVMGLVTIGKYQEEGEIEELCRQHREQEQVYATSLIDSRCLLLGPGGQGDSQSPEPIRPAQCLLYPSGLDDQLEKDLVDLVSSIFWVLESKRLDNSFEKLEKVPMLMAPFEKKDFVGIDTDTRQYRKRCLARMRKHLADLHLQAGLPGEALALYQPAAEQLRATGDGLWLGASLEGLCAASAFLHYPPSLQSPRLHRHLTSPLGGKPLLPKTPSGHKQPQLNGFDPQLDLKALGKSLLSPSEIVDKYRDALNCYANYSSAAIIQMECCSKAIRILIIQEKFLQASEFLMHIVHASYQQASEDRIEQCKALAQHYTDLGFHRKAAFFKRAEALNCINLSSPDYSKCYHTFLEALNGYKLTLDPKAFPQDHIHGWPSLQIKMLLSLVNSAKKMDNPALAVRHLTFLLQTLTPHMTAEEKMEYSAQLEAITSAGGDWGPVTMALDSGHIIPPVNLTRIPMVRSFRPLNLAPHLRPCKLSGPIEHVTSSPFIFSPINHKPVAARDLDFKWVQGDVCEVALRVSNPMPFELKVTNMGLMADGVPFESFPTSLSLPAESSPYPFSLGGTPQQSGELQLQGYQTQVFGVRSHCLLRELSQLGTKRRQGYTVEVVPALPTLTPSTSLPKAAAFSSLANTGHVVTSAQASLYAGQEQSCTLTLTNDSDTVPVQRIDLSIHSRLDKELEGELMRWDREELESQLPIQPHGVAKVTIHLYGAGKFIFPQAADQASKGTESARASPLPASPAHRPLPDSLQPTVYEAVLQVQYSGGPGLTADYGRQCAVAVTVEVSPAVAVTQWDVLPGDAPSHCYLVLDLLNATPQEMELAYAPSKQILIEAGDTCRVPVPVERCPLTVLSGSDLDSACQAHLAERVSLAWSLPGGPSGTASVGDIPWTPDMRDIILTSPVAWDLAIDGHPPDQELSFPPGQLVTLAICLRNLSDTVLQSLYLSIHTFQDHQNGQHNYRLETKRAVVGADKILIQQIPPQGSHCHECRLVFFHAGLYKLAVQCSSGQYVWRYAPCLELSVLPTVI